MPVIFISFYSNGRSIKISKMCQTLMPSLCLLRVYENTCSICQHNDSMLNVLMQLTEKEETELNNSCKVA